MPASPAHHDNPLLTIQEVGRICQCSTRHIFRLVQAKQFPGPISLGSKLKRWRRVQVDRWLAEQSETNGGPHDTN